MALFHCSQLNCFKSSEFQNFRHDMLDAFISWNSQHLKQLSWEQWKRAMCSHVTFTEKSRSAQYQYARHMYFLKFTACIAVELGAMEKSHIYSCHVHSKEPYYWHYAIPQKATCEYTDSRNLEPYIFMLYSLKRAIYTHVTFTQKSCITQYHKKLPASTQTDAIWSPIYSCYIHSRETH